MMKSFRDWVAIGTILPMLLATSAARAASTPPESDASAAAAIRLAQATLPSEEQRRLHKPGPAGPAAHPAAPAGAQAPRPTHVAPGPAVGAPPAMHPKKAVGPAVGGPPAAAPRAVAPPTIARPPVVERPPAVARPPVVTRPTTAAPPPVGAARPPAPSAPLDAERRKGPAGFGVVAPKPTAPIVGAPPQTDKRRRESVGRPEGAAPAGAPPHAPTAPVVKTPAAPVVKAPMAPTVGAPVAAPFAPPAGGGGKPPAPAMSGPAPVAPAQPTAVPQGTTPAPGAVTAPPPAVRPVVAPPVAAPGAAVPPPTVGRPAVPGGPVPGGPVPGGAVPGVGQHPVGPQGTMPPAVGGRVPPGGGFAPATGLRPQPPQQGGERQLPPEGGPRGGDRGGNGVGTALGAAAAGVAIGVVGGMILGGDAHALDDVQRQRREVVRDGSTYYSEPGRVIVRDGNDLYMRHDETERFRAFGGRSYDERSGEDYVKVWERPDGVRIVTVTDADGRLLRRIRRWPDGRDEVLIDNDFRPRPRGWREEVVVLPPPPVPASRWYVDAERSDETEIWDTLRAPPLAPLPRRYTLDEVRASRDLRAYMPAVDVDTITFASGSWTVEPSQISRLDAIARSISKIIGTNPDEIFLVEGHTDAVGSDIDNMSLSDRRAQSVATVLTQTFGIPAENLVTQGYGEQVLKEATEGPSRINRRVTVRRITPLLGSATSR